MMDPSKPGAAGYYHPENEEDIRQLISRAKQENLKIRVRGSAHSVNAAIYTRDYESPPGDERDINIFLDNMRGIVFDDKEMQVTVQAGCHMGRDPADPTKTSTEENSLVHQLEQRKWALPITGGIIHQTVGGFLSTGSSGGSLDHSLGDQLEALTIIDGKGDRQELKRSDDLDDRFYGAAVSMGLLGILTSATFKCVPSFNVTGQEATSSYEKCAIDLFGDGDADKRSLERFFRETEYSRCMWWPQKGVRRIVVWKAKKLPGTPPKPFPKPYHELPIILGSTKPAQIAAGIFMRIVGILNPPGPCSFFGKLIRSLIRPLYFAGANYFLASSVLGPQEFSDVWHRGIPMDNGVDFKWMPTEFLEMWIPISRTKEVMRKLHRHYKFSDIARTGTYCVEIYATPSNYFWMSPAYRQDVVKLDFFWFETNKGNPSTDFYPQFWDLLKDFDFRPHWGKYLLKDPGYLKDQYPMWDKFMDLRNELDPDQIFVTEYWRNHLGIE